jgi:hypothetical protein
MNEAFFPYRMAKRAEIIANTMLTAAASLKWLYCLLCSTFQIRKPNLQLPEL